MKGIRAINGFKIRRFCEGKRRGIFIIYKIDGEFFTQSKYYDVEDSKIEKVRGLLEDYTKTNKEATELCRTIHLVTILNAVENIIFDEE